MQVIGHTAKGMVSAISTTHNAIGILLAAGEGSRYLEAAQNASRPHAADDTVHKLLATLPDGRYVVASSAQTLLSVVPATMAIIGHQPAALSVLLSALGCQTVTVPESPRGMGVSLATAARRLIQRPGTGGQRPGLNEQAAVCVVALADMPWVRADTLKRLLAHAARDRIVVPVHQGRRGHPVIFGAQFLPELAELSGDTGARTLLARHGVLEIECDDVGILRDVDVPADLFTHTQEPVE